MKRTENHFHPVQHKVLWIIVSYAVLYSLLFFITFISIYKYIDHLITLHDSNYIYSATIQSSAGKDDYYKINAGIDFSISKDSKTGLNADIIMQKTDSVYSEDVSWNAIKLNSNEIAISQNIANAKGIRVGDSLYSRHTVNGIVYEYEIKQIIPYSSSANSSKDSNFTDGIIIMGFDSRYIDNISSTTVAFTSEPIDNLAKLNPINLVYREDLISSLQKKTIPYITIALALCILLSIIFVWRLTESIAHDYQRQIILGFPRLMLNRTYKKYIFSASFLADIIIILINLILLGFIREIRFTSLFLLLFYVFTVSIAIMISQAVFNRKVWRA